ncbi:MAG: respiratory nitrate reductase subunit gamma, partial [Desulfovibrionaceae bacterium]|nr:respiratory nitrate reductase subunit gamma [Desulfovibrionaceae bacterium]
QMIAIWAGSIFGLLCLIGGAMLWVRRMFNTRILVTSHGSDKFILSWLLVTLILGLCTIPTSIGHANEGNASVVIALTQWVQSVAFLHPNPALLADVDTIFKVHIFFGLTVFLLFPFTRLVHIWSGFASVSYLFRPYQLVRLRRR